MYRVKNNLFQPLTFNVPGQAGIHLGVRESRDLADEQVSAEMQKAARRGDITLTPHAKPESAETEAGGTTTRRGGK